MERKYGEVMRIVLLASIILQAIAIGMSFAENIGEEKQRIIRYTGYLVEVIDYENRIICVVACMMMLVGCLGLCSCGNYRVFDTTFTYSWAQIKLPDGTIVQGKVDNWTDYEGDQLQITIDGTTYLVHAANAIMKT